jgi:hypothetical protein
VDNREIKLGIGTILILFTYVLIFYLVFTYQYRLDFSSFYSACQALTSHENPYQVLQTTYLPTVKKLSANLNPPVVLWLFMPFSWLNYQLAVSLWSFTSFILGIIGAGLAFHYAFSPVFLKKFRWVLYLVYLSFFPVLVNTAIAQLSSLLLFFLMYGYHLYVKKYDWGSGLCWGLIAAIKIFPALIFIYILVQKRYKVFFWTLGVVVLLWLIPVWLYGIKVYNQYFSMMARVLWYGDSWNASLHGFIFRILVNVKDVQARFFLAEILFFIGFCSGLIWYLFQLLKFQKNGKMLQGFALTLCMMLILSPLGWFYYFSLLMLPLSMTWNAAMRETSDKLKHKIIWLIGMFFINFPMDYVRTFNMESILGKLSVYSFHFYGLLILSYMLGHAEGKPTAVADPNNLYFINCTYIIFIFGFLVLLLSILKHFM